MKLVVDMPWEKDLTHNHCNMGPQGNWHLKPHVEAWMELLGWELLIKYGYYGYWQEIAKTFANGCSIRVDFRFPDKHRRDDHNYHKVICDAVARQLGIDDQHIRISTASVVIDRSNPGFTIEVSDERPSSRTS